MFKTNTSTNSGVTFKFDNGNSISIQWGPNTYSSNRNAISSDYTSNNPATSAEVMIYNGDESIDVFGWLDADKVAKLIAYVSTNDWEDIKKEYDSYSNPADNFFQNTLDE